MTISQERWMETGCLFFQKNNQTHKSGYGNFQPEKSMRSVTQKQGKGGRNQEGGHACQAGYWGDLTLPPPSQVSKLRFGEFCDSPNFAQLVNAEDLTPGVPLTSKGCLPGTGFEIVETTWSSGETAEAGGFRERSLWQSVQFPRQPCWWSNSHPHRKIQADWGVCVGDCEHFAEGTTKSHAKKQL